MKGSLWLDTGGPAYDHPKLRGTVETDTVVVGGGLAGVLCAHLLGEQGVDAVVVEAGEPGAGTSGHTTAKITAQHSLLYSRIQKRYGLEAARIYLRANQEAVEEYRRLAEIIPCDFTEQTAYIYSTKDRSKLEEEAKIYRRLGLEAIFQERPPLPIPTVGALGMAHQAQFHPVKFLRGIARGLTLYRNSPVLEVQPGQVVTPEGAVRARRIILATHYPMVNVPGLYIAKMTQSRSYLLALTGAPDPGGMYLDEAGTGLSFRTQGPLLLLGGGAHPTGKPGGGIQALRQAAQAAYPQAQEAYSWAAQDCMTLDGIPYIGKHHRGNRELWVATGFNKWGITGSMVAAQLLTQLLTQGDSPAARLFAPSRTILHPQLVSNLAQSAAGLLSFGKRCSHLGCALRWNPQERSWDCPCHGSRFDPTGRVLDNPAKRGIDP